MTILTMVFEALVIALCCVAGGWRLLHYFQLESYQLPGYIRSIRRNAQRALVPPLAISAVGVVSLRLGVPTIIRLLLCAALAAVIFLQAKKEKAKKPFVITERVKRLICVHAAAALALALLIRTLLPAVLAYLLPAFEPLILALSAMIAQPIEKNINNQFLNDARRRLDAMPGLIKIGITGSYGKTSTKFLLRDILSVKYKSTDQMRKI